MLNIPYIESVTSVVDGNANANALVVWTMKNMGNIHGH